MAGITKILPEPLDQKSLFSICLVLPWGLDDLLGSFRSYPHPVPFQVTPAQMKENRSRCHRDNPQPTEAQ